MISCRFRYTAAESRALQAVSKNARPISYVTLVAGVSAIGTVVGLGVAVLVGRALDLASPWPIAGWPALAATAGLFFWLAHRFDGTTMGDVPEVPEQTVTLAEDRITVADGQCETRWTWAAFTGWSEREGCLALALPDGRWLLLPLRGFADAAAIAEARATIAAHLAPV